MKKTYSIAFCVLMLCSLLLIGTATATEAGYSLREYYMGSAVTTDGKWTTAAEWSDAWLELKFPTSANARFYYKAVLNEDMTNVFLSFNLEFADTTNDAGDIWVICIDGNADGGTAPNTNDNKIEITGHNTLKYYVGTGTTWNQTTIAASAIKWNNTLTTSPLNNATNHWVLEVQGQKDLLGAWGANQPPEGLYIGMYDASNPSQGWVQWPPTSPDNPGRWGLISEATGDALPEGLSFAVVVALSSVAIVVGTIYLRKKPKTTILPAPRLKSISELTLQSLFFSTRLQATVINHWLRNSCPK